MEITEGSIVRCKKDYVFKTNVIVRSGFEGKVYKSSENKLYIIYEGFFIFVDFWMQHFNLIENKVITKSYLKF